MQVISSNKNESVFGLVNLESTPAFFLQILPVIFVKRIHERHKAVTLMNNKT